MINYVSIGANDIALSTNFWEAVLTPLGYKKCWESENGAALAPDGDYNKMGSVFIGKPYNKETAIPSNGTMPGFFAASRAAVDAFHAAALANGGSCEGAPGLREQYGPNMYLAYIRDPIGNKFSALCTASE